VVAVLPDIVLVDVEVPALDGYTVAAHVKQSSRLRHVPVLLLASAFDPVDRDRASAIGCDGILVKPFEPQQLVTRVTELLNKPQTVDAAGDVSAAPSPAAAFGVKHAGNGLAQEPEPLEPPSKPVWELGLPSGPAGSMAEAPPAAAPPKVSLASAFSALLAAERSHHPAAAAPPAPAPAAPISEAAIEDAVRRVLAKMPDDVVRRIVLETAERLVKEEIEKIKAGS
jgi:hypothetical protein